MTYAQLVARLKQYTEDNEAPFAGAIDPLIDDIIDRAEKRISKDLHCDAMLVTARPTAVLPAGQYWIAKPADWIANNHFTLFPQPSGTPIVLAFRTRSFVERVYPVSTTRGDPRYYCNYDHTSWRMAPAVNVACSAEIIYEARISGLSAVTPSTWISANQPELLFKACLTEAEVYHKSPDTKAMYEADYMADLDRTKGEISRQRSDATNLVRARI